MGTGGTDVTRREEREETKQYKKYTPGSCGCLQDQGLQSEANPFHEESQDIIYWGGALPRPKPP